jgi:hypothetical protein
MSIDKQITLNMSTNASNTGNNALFVPIIVQDGKIYFATLVSGPHIFTTPGTSNYDTLSASIVAAQFLQFDPVQISVPGQPNFAGGTMLFGVAASTPVGVTGPPGLAETINFDNLAVRINDVPLPAALPLFATGLGVLALLGWRRKRTTARMISLPTVLGVVSCVILTAATSASYASTITLRTNDATVVAAFGEAGQGWWNNTDPAVDTNTNYAAGVGFRDFLTFDLNNPLLTGQTIVGATLRLQAFGSQQTGTLRFFDVTSNPVAVNNNVGTNATIWSDLGSGTVYGSLTITTTPSSADILSIPLNAAAIAALNAGIGAGFFVFGGDYDSGFLFFGSFDNGNQQLVLEVIPIPAALPLFATGLGALGLLGWRRKRKQAA